MLYGDYRSIDLCTLIGRLTMINGEALHTCSKTMFPWSNTNVVTAVAIPVIGFGKNYAVF